MSCPACSRARSETAANSGVPAKTRRMGRSHTPVEPPSAAGGRGRQAENAAAGLAYPSLLLADAGKDAPALERRQVFDEDLALQMIHLVLDAYGQQAVGLELERFALGIERSHPYPLRPRDLVEHTGHRKAALLGIGCAAAFDDLGI